MSGFSNVTSALKVSETAISIASKNISNVNTEGYKRQRVNQSEVVGGSGATGFQIGLGARIDSIEQVYNELKEQAYRESLANLGELEIENDVYTYIQSALSLTNLDGKELEEQKGVFDSTIDNIWQTANNLATDSSSLTYRLAFQESIVAFLNETETAMGKLDALQEEINNEITTVVNKINELAEEICDLNKRVCYAKASGRDVLELEDMRSSVIEELSELIEINIETYPNSDALLIRCGGGYLVSKSEVNPIKLAQNTETSIYDIPVWSNTEEPIELTSGRLKGLLDSRGHNIVGNLTDPLNGSPREKVEIEIYIDDSMNAAEVRDNIEKLKATLDAHNVNYKMNIHETGDIHGSIAGMDTTAFDKNSNKYLMVFTKDTLAGTQANINSSISKLNSIDMRVIAVTDNTNTALVDSWSRLTSETEGSIYDINSKFEELGDNLVYNINSRLKDNEYDGIIAGVKSKLSVLVSAFVRVVNGVFSEGTNYAGEPNTGNFDIFQKIDDNLPWQIGNIELNPALSDLDKWPLLASEGVGDNRLVEKLAEMREKDVFSDSGESLTFDGYYEKLVLDLGTDASQTLTSLSNQETIVRDADNARKAVSGVSLDQELADIIKFQYAYTGASRMLTVLDEMTEVVQNLV